MAPNCTGTDRATAEDIDSALTLRLKVLQIEEILGSQRGMAESCRALADLYLMRGEHPRALEMLQRGLDIEKALGRSERVAAFSVAIGRLIAAREGEVSGAVPYYLQAFQGYMALKRTASAAACCEALAGIHQRRGHWERAEEMLHQAVALRRQARAVGPLTRAQTRLAEVLLHRSNHLEAHRVLQSLQQTSGVPSHPRHQADLWGLQAVIHIWKDRKDQARPLLRKACQYHLTAGNPIGWADNSGNLANIAWSEGDLVTAEAHYLCALGLFEYAGQRAKAGKTLGLLLDLQHAKQARRRPSAGVPADIHK